MPKLPYVPARDCCHRIAAIALYRALIQTARHISLPQDGIRNHGDVHPVVHLVRQRFKGNKDYTSLRLVYSSMTAGYKFLDMLHKAKEPKSPERKQITALLRKMEKSWQTQQAKRSPSSDTPAEPEYDYKNRDPAEFTLHKVSGPFEPSRYIGKVRPLSSLKKRRQVPILAAETLGFPFLRYGQLQPVGLNHMIRSHKSQWTSAMSRLISLEEETAPDVQWQDVWEENLVKASREEDDLEPLRMEEMDQDPQSSYVWAVQVSRFWYELRLEKLWQDYVARGTTLAGIVKEEKKLQEKEDMLGVWGPSGEKNEAVINEDGKKALERKAGDGLRLPMAPEGMDPALFADVMKQAGETPSPINKVTAKPPAPPRLPITHPQPTTKDDIRVVKSFKAQPSFLLWEEALKAYFQSNSNQPPPIDPTDPFINPVWGNSVVLANGRIRRAMSRVPNAGANARFLKKGKKTKKDDDDDDDEGGGIFDMARARAAGEW